VVADDRGQPTNQTRVVMSDSGNERIVALGGGDHLGGSIHLNRYNRRATEILAIRVRPWLA